MKMKTQDDDNHADDADDDFDDEDDDDDDDQECHWFCQWSWQQRYASANCGCHRLQCLSVPGPGHPVVVEFLTQHGSTVRWLPVLLQSHQQRTGRHQLRRQLSHLPALQQALSHHPQIHDLRTGSQRRREAAPFAERPADSRLWRGGEGACADDRWTSHGDAVTLSVDGRSSGETLKPRRRRHASAVDHYHVVENEVNRYCERMLYHGGLMTTVCCCLSLVNPTSGTVIGLHFFRR